MTVIKVGNVERLGRGGGVVTIPLITRQSAEEENLITTYPVGTGAPYLPQVHQREPRRPDEDPVGLQLRVRHPHLL